MILTIFSVIILSALFIFLGARLFASVHKLEDLPTELIAGFGYFFGMAVFLAAWRFLAALMHRANISFWIVLAISIVWIAWGFKNKFPAKVNWKKIAIWGGLLLLTILLQIGLWLQVAPTSADPFENFGSAHSVRYTNIANFIVSQNYMPVLNQNIGQSMLASGSLLFGGSAPFVALNLWLSASILFLALAVYGLLKYFGVRRAGLGTFLFMFGNTALSFTHVLSLDSNSPFAMSSYTDATAAVGSFLFFMFLVASMVRNKNINFKSFLGAAGVLAIYWNFSGPQNLVAALAFLFIFCLYYLYKKHELRTKVVRLAAVIFLCMIIGAAMGGMLTPSRFRDKVTIPGTGEVYRPGEYTGIKPELPYGIGWAYQGLHYGTPYDPAEKAMYVNLLRGGKTAINGELVYNILWRLESNFWASLRVMFFPLAGLVLFYFYFKKRKDQNNTDELFVWWHASVWVYAFCFLLTFMVIVSGRKWEMSRFMMEPYALGLLLGIIAFLFWTETLSRIKALWALWGLSFVMTVGPVVNGLGIMHRFFYKSETVNQRFSAFTKNPGIMGQEVWREWLLKNNQPDNMNVQ